MNRQSSKLKPTRKLVSSTVFNEKTNCATFYRVAKDQKKATRAAKKATAPPAAKKQQPKQKAAKNVQKAAPRVGGKR